MGKDQVSLGQVGVPTVDLKYIALPKMLLFFYFALFSIYFTLFNCMKMFILYVKHFESALCMKSAI